jgi:hypothetical protein
VTATLTHDRKRVRCENVTATGRCFRVIAWRMRHPSGQHFLVTYRDWRIVTDHYERPWRRREEGHQASRTARGKSAMAWDPTIGEPVTADGPFRCGCGTDLLLDAERLDCVIGPEAIRLTYG